MNPPCRLLLIEDDHAEATAIERACCPDPSSATFDVANNGAQAEDALLEREYDLIICDLALPADARLLEPDTAEGLRLFRLIREHSQGTPVIVLSGHADFHMLQGFFQANRTADLYGTLTEQPLVQFFAKENLPDCIDAVKSHVARTGVLDGVRLTTPKGVELTLSDERALRIFARRKGAILATLDPLDGGLSGASTFRMTLTDAAGDTCGVAVAKLGSLRKVMREANRYEQVSTRLPVGLGALVLFVVHAGAGQRGALFYQLADEHTSSLFGLVAESDPAALKAVDRLEQRLSEWVANAPTELRSLSEIRRPLIADLELRTLGVEIPDEERDVTVTVREALAHGDLHGFNVLVTPQGEPTLIDYGEVQRAPAALDPLTLELSLLFHPGMTKNLGTWPAEEQAKAWLDLDVYCQDCPYEDFVRTCRSWASSVGSPDEVAATGYAYAMRQAKYQNPTLPLALAIAEGAMAALRS